MNAVPTVVGPVEGMARDTYETDMRAKHICKFFEGQHILLSMSDDKEVFVLWSIMPAS